jgi:hypothetical protein
VPGAAVYGAQHSINPRLGFSTVLKGATFVASWGRFSQAPDFQYLVDAAFDDTLRTGRFRRGNPNLGFEDATQYEFSLRMRPSPTTNLRINVFNKLLDGLVASVPLGIDPDSTIFGNLDYGDVRARKSSPSDRCGALGCACFVHAAGREATATNAFQLPGAFASIPAATPSIPRVTFPLDYDRRHNVTFSAKRRSRHGRSTSRARTAVRWL